ncbi:hypothetical protein BT96DRAFT_1025181 [Gymnopus androsaceus JB14]|uniref:Uncharacterized protein n=1 Tax=Gymnopus androsaceus JB14 TaxID=1447944 RepID=A0A6A4GTL0_9AGAR|nr:hypothetical protein BT96DRAFT_1025181 [Gymnopus androsaceus JB14]
MDNSSGMQKFNGLREVEVQLKKDMSFSWLLGFTRAHPHLKRISFIDGFDFLRSSNTVPFIQPLFEALRQQGVYNAVRIQGFSVTRSIPSASSTDVTGDWEVTGLHLRQVADRHILPWMRPYILTLRFCYQFLEMGNPWPADHRRLPGFVETEAGLIQHTSRIAREIPSIEAFYLEEQESSSVEDEPWSFRGWIDARKDMTKLLAMMPSSESRRCVSRFTGMEDEPWSSRGWIVAQTNVLAMMPSSESRGGVSRFIGNYMAKCQYISQKHSGITFFI